MYKKKRTDNKRGSALLVFCKKIRYSSIRFGVQIILKYMDQGVQIFRNEWTRRNKKGGGQTCRDMTRYEIHKILCSDQHRLVPTSVSLRTLDKLLKSTAVQKCEEDSYITPVSSLHLPVGVPYNRNFHEELIFVNQPSYKD